METADEGDQELKARFKRYVLESLAQRRALELELAGLRYPELYDREIGVVAAVSRAGDVPTSWPSSASVVITNFNYGRYVAGTLESVLDQTHNRLEIVVVDDNSTDHSADVLTRVLEQVTSVPWQLAKLKHNVGLPTARNTGVRLARGEFVFVLDADNHLLSPCVEAHIKAAQKETADAAYGMIRTFGGATRVLSDAPFSAERLARGPYIDAMALFRRSALLEMGMYSTEAELYGWEDYELWLRLAAHKRRVAFIPSELSHYRVHGQNMISVASMDTRGAWTYLFEKYPTLFGDLSPAVREAETERRARFAASTVRLASRSRSDLEVPCGCESRPVTTRWGSH